MSFRGKLVSAATSALAVVALAGFAAAQDSNQTEPAQKEKREWRGGKRDGFGKGFRGGRHGGGMHGLRGLNLTDAQKEQVRSIREANRPDEATVTEMRTLRQARREGTLTAEQQERMRALREQARARGEQVRQQILAILTPEQRQQLEQKKEEMRKLREQRRELRRQNKQATPTDKQDN